MSFVKNGPEFSSRLSRIQSVEHGGMPSFLLNQNGEDFIDLSTNVHSYGPPSWIKEVIQRVNLERYPDVRAGSLCNALASQLGISPDMVSAGNGSTELISSIASAFLNQNDRVVICSPTFGEYRAAAYLNGAEVIEFFSYEQDFFQVNLNALLAEVKKYSPKLVFLCNPNNPTGQFFETEAVNELAELVAAGGGLLVIDEAYTGLMEEYHRDDNLLEMVVSGKVCLLRSLTKEFALPGLRLGYCIAHPQISAALRLIQPPWSVNAFAQAVGTELLNDFSYRSEIRSQLNHDKKYLLSRLAQIKSFYIPGKANFVLIKTGNGTKTFQSFLKGHLAVRDCTSFGLPEYIRVGVGKPAATDRLIDLLLEGSNLPENPKKASGFNPVKRERRGKTLMIQGTASSVGKSTVAAGLCRLFAQQGLRVAPFKAQNMALNSYITREGGEIGRAQVSQAEACGIEPSVYMNPILLKPEGESRSQVIVLGKVLSSMSAREYYKNRGEMLGVVEDSLNKLRQEYDLVIIEGAGSPVEMNLKKNDIVNMKIARLAQSPVLLVSDIDRGGVFASVTGTLALLEQEERELVKGIIINKFRGDPRLFDDGIDFLQKKTGKSVIGVLPYFTDIKLAEEDSVVLSEKPRRLSESLVDQNGKRAWPLLDICVIHLPHISNFDDFDALEIEDGVSIRYIKEPQELGNPDVVIIPGTKTSIADLTFMVESGLAREVQRIAGNGTPVIGICGGYQMLGTRIDDPERVESREGSVLGLGLLPVKTLFVREKVTSKVRGRISSRQGIFKGLEGLPITGYEIHMGRTEILEEDFTEGNDPRNLIRLTEREGTSIDQPDGFINQHGNVWGTYLHGLFANDNFRHALLNNLLKSKGTVEGIWKDLNFKVISKDQEYDRLSELFKANLNINLLRELAQI